MMLTLFWVLFGVGIGVLQVAMQLWSMNHLQARGRGASLGWLVSDAAARWGLTLVLLAVALTQGIVPGLLAAGGWWLLRTLACYWLAQRC